MKKNRIQDNFEVLREIYKNPKASQREMAQILGFSLGKLNYCLRALKSKGLVKINNFKKKKTSLTIYSTLLPQKAYQREQDSPWIS